MLTDELHQRYGQHLAKRLEQELGRSEFGQLVIGELPVYLEMRAEAAHQEYQKRIDNPFLNGELGHTRAEYIDLLYTRWREAEELAYLVMIAEDVNANARATG